MKVEITNSITGEVVDEGDFDEKWDELGRSIKFALRTYDPALTWLNLYISHDSVQSFNRTIARTQEQ